jgi:hypothetical protein
MECTLNHRALAIAKLKNRTPQIPARGTKMSKNIVNRIRKSKDGNAAIVAVLAIAAVFFLASLLGIHSLNDAQNELDDVQMNFEQGLQVVETKTYNICYNVQWSEIKAAGVKITETSLKGFLQLCERLALNLGNLKVYADVEARVMWVYADPSHGGNDLDVYYIQFT